MTEKEFAKVYLDSLSKKYPTVSFELNSDLTITSKKGDLDYKHYIDNAFIAYKAEPDSVNSIISRYVASTTDLYIDQKAVKVENIVPVIKPIEYLDEINSLNKDGKSFPMITEKYNDQLIIAYAEDSKNSIKYLTEDDFKNLSISRDTLKSIALKNFDKIIPNIQRQGDDGLFMITAGGDYEASLILISSIWTKENFPVAGEFIIAIPNRDMLMVTGVKTKLELVKSRKLLLTHIRKGITKFLTACTNGQEIISRFTNKYYGQHSVWQYGGATNISSAVCSLFGFISSRRIKLSNRINNELLFINLASVTG